MRRWPLLVVLAVLVTIVVVGRRGNDRPAPTVPPIAHEATGPSFEVHVRRPRVHQPLFGVLPPGVFGLPPVSSFDQASPGAVVRDAGPRHLALAAEGWELSLVASDGERIAPETYLVYPMEPGGPALRCRPAHPPVGHYRLTTPPGAAEIGGSFLVELVRCENARTGEGIDWPSRPLTVVGRFERLPATGAS